MASPQLGPMRQMSSSAFSVFLAWTALGWGIVGVCFVGVFLGHMGFELSTKVGLYSVAVWLNGWITSHVRHGQLRHQAVTDHGRGNLVYTVVVVNNKQVRARSHDPGEANVLRIVVLAFGPPVTVRAPILFFFLLLLFVCG
jgi:hypothetical protein